MYHFSKVNTIQKARITAQRKSKYDALFNNFMESGYRYAVIDAEGEDSRKLWNRLNEHAKKCKLPVSVHKRGDRTYLENKNIK